MTLYRVVPHGTKFALRETATGHFVVTDLGRIRIFATEKKALAEAARLTDLDDAEKDYDYRDHCSLL